jgi:hypothetical protein
VGTCQQLRRLFGVGGVFATRVGPEELLDKTFEKLERRVVNPFNYWQLYAGTPKELVGTLPYRANLKGVIDVPGRVAMYGSAGVELNNL